MNQAKPLLRPIDKNDVVAMTDDVTARPRLALMFHVGQHRLRMVTLHGVKEGDWHGPVIEPGRILTPEDEAELTRLLMLPDEEDELEIFPENLLCQGRHSVAWYVPAARRPMLMKGEDSQVTALDVVWPNLVFHSVRGELRVASYLGGRPEATTLLYHAPLANVFADTRLCLGTAKIPATSRIADISACEAAMFESAFTHQNHHDAIVPSKDGSSRVTSSDPMKVWPKFDGQESSLPDKHLSPLRMTLAEWLRGAE